MSSVIERLRGLVDDITATADGRDIRKLIAAYEAVKAENDMWRNLIREEIYIHLAADKCKADSAVRELEGE